MNTSGSNVAGATIPHHDSMAEKFTFVYAELLMGRDQGFRAIRSQPPNGLCTLIAHHFI